MLRLLAILLVGLGVFVGANAWQQREWDSAFRDVPNLFGQICQRDLCFRPEWLAVGLVGVLVGTWIFLANRQSPDVGGYARSIASFARRNRMVLVVVAAALGALSWLVGLGSVTASASFLARCPSEKPILLTVRNLAFGVVRNTAIQLMVAEGNGTSHPDILIVTRSLQPFEAFEQCVGTIYTDAVIRPSDASSDAGGLDTVEVLDQVDRSRALRQRSTLAVAVLSHE